MFGRLSLALALASGCVYVFADEGDEPIARPRERSIIKQPAEIGSGVLNARPLPGAASNSLRDAYLKSRAARTVEDYSQIIATCEQALEGQDDEAVRLYVMQLLAWAANRRGEARSQEAAQFSTAGKMEAAAARDAEALTDFGLAVAADATKWKALHNRGVSFALTGRFEEALSDLTKAIELNGTYVNTWYNRAEVRYELGQYEDAASDYSEVLARQPDDFGAYIGRGHAWFRMGELNKALADYNQAVALDPTSAGSLINRGDTYRQLGQWGKASADYRAALKLDAQSGRAYRAAAWLMATCPDEKFRNTELAIEAAEKALELDGAHADFAYDDALAAALASAGRYSEAITAAERALTAAPDEAKLGLEERLQLYRAGKPYRLIQHVGSGPTPARR
jgi:tetratricopeptide (TPR) repeat protein